MGNRTECEDVVRRLWPYLDGALPESEQARVVRHLELCGGCASHFGFAQSFLNAVAASRPYVEEAGPLRTRVLTALQSEGFQLPAA